MDVYTLLFICLFITLTVTGTVVVVEVAVDYIRFHCVLEWVKSTFDNVTWCFVAKNGCGGGAMCDGFANKIFMSTGTILIQILAQTTSESYFSTGSRERTKPTTMMITTEFSDTLLFPIK